MPRPSTAALEEALAALEAEQGHPDYLAREALAEVQECLGKACDAHAAADLPDGEGEEWRDAAPAAAAARAEAVMNEITARMYRVQKNLEDLDGPGRALVAAALADAGFGVPE